MTTPHQKALLAVADYAQTAAHDPNTSPKTAMASIRAMLAIYELTTTPDTP